MHLKDGKWVFLYQITGGDGAFELPSLPKTGSTPGNGELNPIDDLYVHPGDELLGHTQTIGGNVPELHLIEIKQQAWLVTSVPIDINGDSETLHQAMTAIKFCVQTAAERENFEKLSLKQQKHQKLSTTKMIDTEGNPCFNNELGFRGEKAKRARGLRDWLILKNDNAVRLGHKLQKLRMVRHFLLRKKNTQSNNKQVFWYVRTWRRIWQTRGPMYGLLGTRNSHY